MIVVSRLQRCLTSLRLVGLVGPAEKKKGALFFVVVVLVAVVEYHEEVTELAHTLATEKPSFLSFLSRKPSYVSIEAPGVPCCNTRLRFQVVYFHHTVNWRCTFCVEKSIQTCTHIQKKKKKNQKRGRKSDSKVEKKNKETEKKKGGVATTRYVVTNAYPDYTRTKSEKKKKKLNALCFFFSFFGVCTRRACMFFLCVCVCVCVCVTMMCKEESILSFWSKHRLLALSTLLGSRLKPHTGRVNKNRN